MSKDFVRQLGLSYYKGFFGKVRFLFVCVLAALAFYMVMNMAAKYSARIPIGKSVIDIEREIGTKEEEVNRQDYTKLSEQYTMLPSNEMEWTQAQRNEQGELAEKAGLYCISKENLKYSVYNIDSVNICQDGYKFSDFDHIWVNSEDNNFYAVINVSGKLIDLSDYYILARDEKSLYASHVLFNFYEAESVILKNTVFTGTLLAPLATVYYDNTFVYGQVLASETVGKQAYYKELAFKGQNMLENVLDLVNIENIEIRRAAIRYLIENDTIGRYDGYDASYSLTMTDLNSVERLDLSGVALEANAGEEIKYFKNLKFLSLNNTVLDKIDVSEMKDLEELQLKDTMISELDLSGNRKLKKLCIDSVPIKSLNISVNTELTVLTYSRTPIGWLDIPENSKLQYLDCSMSSISEESVISGKNLPALETLIIYGNTNVKAIDVYSFRNLKSLDCSDCSLDALDLAKCYSLVYLKCNGNSYTTLNAYEAVNLKYLEAYSDKLLTIDTTGLVLYNMFTKAAIVTRNDDANE